MVKVIKENAISHSIIAEHKHEMGVNVHAFQMLHRPSKILEMVNISTG